MANNKNLEIRDDELSKLKRKLQDYADNAGFKLNDDEKALEFVIKGLLKNKEKHGEIYCPCRVVTGNKTEDKKIICPCVYHQGEIELTGKCRCALFWKK